MANYVLKVTCMGETHKVPLAPMLSPKEPLQYATILKAVDAITPRPEAYIVKYTDEEGDLCTLVDASFEDFLEAALEVAPDASGHATLKLQVLPVIGQPACGTDSVGLKEEKLAEIPRRMLQLGLPESSNGPNKSIQTRSQWQQDTRDIDELLKEIGETKDIITERKASKQKKPRKKRMKPGTSKAADQEEMQPSCDVQVEGLAENAETDGGYESVDGEVRCEESSSDHLYLWPSTPENTPPSTPRSINRPQPTSTCGMQVCEQQQRQQVVWVPVLMPLAGAGGSMTMQGLHHAPVVPWVS